MGLPVVDQQPSGAAVEERRTRGWLRSRRAVAALIAVLVVAVLGTFALTRGPDTPPITKRDVDKAVADGIAEAEKKAQQQPPDAAAAYQAVAPSVVRISTERTAGDNPGRGSGAGVVVSQDGTVLTALHVVEDASSIRVRFADGTVAEASIDESDPRIDIATLTPTRLPQVVVPAVLGGGVQVGDPVFALGHPLGLTDSLSAGVVSATERAIRVSPSRTLEDLIQFDAAVNPGNSGGPLLNRGGQVVGIVTGLANPSDQNFFVGIGFAVPIAAAGGAAGAPPQ